MCGDTSSAGQQDRSVTVRCGMTSNSRFASVAECSAYAGSAHSTYRIRACVLGYTAIVEHPDWIVTIHVDMSEARRSGDVWDNLARHGVPACVPTVARASVELRLRGAAAAPDLFFVA